MEGFKGKWLQTSAELYDEFLKVSLQTDSDHQHFHRHRHRHRHRHFKRISIIRNFQALDVGWMLRKAAQVPRKIHSTHDDDDDDGDDDDGDGDDGDDDYSDDDDHDFVCFKSS